MEHLLYYLLFAVGLVLIIKASDLFIDAAIWIARVTKIPDMIIGATLVSLCTTLPEAVVSSVSAARGLPEMAFGNAFGSIIFNTTFILGITFLISRPPVSDRMGFLKNTAFLLLLSIGAGTLLLAQGEISRWAGVVLLILLAAYLLVNVFSAGKNQARHTPADAVERGGRAAMRNLCFLIVGAAGVVIGSNLLVTNGEQIARLLGVSDLIIGLTITAVGTSLPELVTAIQAMVKKAHNISVGNIIGADILNILLVIGLSSVIHPVRLDSLASALFSVAAVLVVCGCVLWFGLVNRRNFTRKDGVLLLALYITYVGVNLMYFA